jgi:hypothetical protein
MFVLQVVEGNEYREKANMFVSDGRPPPFPRANLGSKR